LAESNILLIRIVHPASLRDPEMQANLKPSVESGNAPSIQTDNPARADSHCVYRDRHRQP
jgi:hypothetical protein